MPSSGDDEARRRPPPWGRDHWPSPAAPGQSGLWSAPASSASLAPATRSDGAAWLVFALVGFVVGQIVALLAAAVGAAVTGNSGHLSQIENLAAPPAWYIGSSLIGLWVGFFLAPVIASRSRGTRRFAADLGIAFRVADLLGLLIGVGGQVVVTVLYLPFISHLHNFSAPTTKLTGGAHGGSFAVIAIMTVLGAPFFEEVFFRGLLFRGLLSVLGATGPRLAAGTAGAGSVLAAVLLDGLLFGAAHAELEQLAGLAVFGCILAVVAFKTGRLGMNMVAHATFNFVAVIAIATSRSGVIH